MVRVMKLLSRRRLAVLALLPLLATVAACGSSSSKAGSASNSSGSASVSGSKKSTIVIGNVGNYSNAGQFGPEYLQAAHSLQAWATFTNAHGGLNGHPVKIIVKDDASNPSTSLQAVKELITQDHVDLIAAVMAPGTDPAWEDYVKAEKVPVIGGLALDAGWDSNPYMLSTNIDQVNFLTGQFAAARSYGTKLGVMTCAELAACKSGIPFFQKLATGFGLGYTGAQLISASSVAYTAQCQALKDKGTDVLIPELDGPTTRRVIDSCAQQNFKPALVLPASDIDSTSLNDSAFDGAVGVSVSPLWFGTSDVTKDWATAYKAQFPNDVLFGYATLGWQAGEVIGAALKNAPDTITSQTVLDGLAAQPAKSTFGGWTPPLTFTAGKSTTTTACLWYVQVKNKTVTAPKGQGVVCPS
jgi:branched-chain amino acid transport system substrate-binding protein